MTSEITFQFINLYIIYIAAKGQNHHTFYKISRSMFNESIYINLECLVYTSCVCLLNVAVDK